MHYDIVIVGAGSAGCVLAARLSDAPGRSVLVLEAGPDYPDPAALPADIKSGLRPTFSHDWDYHSEPGHLGRPIHLARARLVGGCSATNATAAVRGLPGDYDDWATSGNPGWSFAEVLPFFRRVERDHDFDAEWHGRDGPVPIRRYRPEELSPVQRAFLAACAAAGYERVDDHNAPGVRGAGPLPVNAVGGRRESAALTYLLPARARPNLTIRGDALVDRVVWQGRRAAGVRLATTGETIRADRIILAAGAYGSPAILLRSGIGSADHLRRLGIAVVADRPGVGENLIDHPLLGLRYATAMTDDAPFAQTLLTLPSSPVSQGFDLHLLPTSAFPVSPSESPGGAAFILFIGLMKPVSRGRLRLHTADPGAAPAIDSGFLTHPADLARLVEGVRLARRLARTPPLAEIVSAELFPGGDVADTVTELEAAVHIAVETYHHPVGTCRMGPASDAQAVVDARGNVYGVDGLSVVDASIMPTIPAANTNLPTLMIAERCVDWLAAAV